MKMQKQSPYERFTLEAGLQSCITGQSTAGLKSRFQ